MSHEDQVQRRAAAASQFDQHERRTDGTRVADSLADGLNLLRESFFTRVHSDVEQAFGMDSMLAPLSAAKSVANTKTEIDLYQLVESVADARSSRYLSTQDDWYLEWLGRLRLGDAAAAPGATQRVADYRSKTADERRHAFAVVLERTLPQARRAPLVAYRLLPLAVSITTAIAFGDHGRAGEVRKQQVSLLPGIRDCHECRGRLLEIGEKCQVCGNPFWKFNWLTAT